MILSFRHTLLAASLTFISQPLLAAEPQVLAEVNGTAVTQQQLESYAQARRSQGIEVPADMLLSELVNRELITQDATRKKLHEDDSYVALLNEQRSNLLAAYTLQNIIQNTDITEEMLRAEYQNMVDALSEQEYLASHILLEEKAQAEEVISALQDGANFAELAKEKSIGPSGEEGGSLDWFRAEAMVEPFALAVKGMKKDEISAQPVQTQFGWHVIQLRDTRQLPPPSFESVKEQLRNQAINNLVTDYIKGLRENANIMLRDG